MLITPFHIPVSVEVSGRKLSSGFLRGTATIKLNEAVRAARTTILKCIFKLPSVILSRHHFIVNCLVLSSSITWSTKDTINALTSSLMFQPMTILSKKKILFGTSFQDKQCGYVFMPSV